ncbi:MAG: hypothetical protein IT361_11390 [Gemmatimonadaceae bacterium]|nr:hypothetical protein [Gemmatimonadaceae bacterium]
MALAILRPARVPGPSGALAFDLELGSNRYHQFVIGGAGISRASGFPQLDEPSYTSALFGPLPESSFGRTTLLVPRERFDRDHRNLQVTSFRTRAREGPAWSDIVRVSVAGPVRDDLPLPAFGVSMAMDTYSDATSYGAPAPWQRAEPMAYREVPAFSNAMLFGSLIPVIGKLAAKVLPAIVNVGKVAGGGAAPDIGGLVSQIIGGARGVVAAPPGIETLVKPETLQLIAQLLEQLRSPQPANAPAQAKALALGDGYSHAAVAPALLAALPALMPLLEKVANPETIKAILEHTDPSKIIGAVTNGVKEIGNLGLEHNKQENEHLRALNPMGVHAPVDDLLKGLGFASSLEPGVSKEKGEPRYRRIESVTLTFAGASPVMIHGRTRVCYRLGEEIAFPFDVQTPRPVTGARITLQVKHVATRAILARRTVEVPSVTSGRLAARAALTKEDTARLRAGEEYLICAWLTWKTKKGSIVGTSRMQLITLVGEYIFDRVEDGKVIPLNDVAKHRPFWHKVWQGAFDPTHFRVDLEGKYFYVLDPKKDANAPIATSTKFEAGEGKVKRGRLRSGMTASLAALNALIPLVSTGKALGEAQLKALAGSDFVSRFHTAARFHGSLKGKAGVSATLWVYPEVKLHEVVLLKAASTDADAHVRELVEERVFFPVPVSIHVIGTRTTS